MKKWFAELRPQFLLLAVLVATHGAALAYWKAGSVSVVNALLALAALYMMHGSVNALNDWHDYEKSGIDREIRQTPFSGGSGLVPTGVLTARGALMTGVVTLAIGVIIGLYLVWESFRMTGTWTLLVIGILGVSSIVLYTPLWTRIGLGEAWAGLGLGLLPVLGAYYLLTGALDPAAWVSGLAAFFLTFNLLLLNEFPDAEADRHGGRRHLVIRLGKRDARVLYVAAELAAFVTIVIGVGLGALTPWALLGLIALVPAIQAIRGAWKHYEGFEELFPAMGANIQAVLGINLFLAIGYAIAGVLAR